MSKRLVALTTAAILIAAGIGGARAQSFYEGKTIRLVVGFAPGGGFDTYARVLSRHVGRHSPGNPTLVVENMTGAGSLISANHLYRVAKPDGLTIGHFNGALFLGQALGQPGIEFDARKFELIGAPIKEPVCALTRASGITSIDKWTAAKTPVKLGGVAPAARRTPTPGSSRRRWDCRSSSSPAPRAPPRSGWPRRPARWPGRAGRGSRCGRPGAARWTREVVAVHQTSRRAFPDLATVPLASSLAKTDEARQLIIQNAAAFELSPRRSRSSPRSSRS